jgi:16S rRNA (adenine1518-N6/adenine1519-N6)-dimethyltransferase
VSRRRWGQHFLADRHIAGRIVELAGIAGRRVLEIGPGRGALSDLLAERCSQLSMVEIDPRLADQLRQRYQGRADVRVVEGDILDLEPTGCIEMPAHVVANLPYETGTRIIAHLLAARPRFTDMTVMLQREVADRLLASENSPAYGRLSVMTALLAEVREGIKVPPDAFRPAPRVHSKVVRLRPYTRPPHQVGDDGLFDEVVSRAFSQRRKMLRNTLLAWLSNRLGGREQALACLESAGIGLTQRPQEVSVSRFAELSRLVWEGRDA